MIARTVPMLALVLIAMTGSALGQNLPVGSSAGESEEDRMAREVDDPTAILMQLQLQDLYTPKNFQTSAQTNTIQLRAVVPIEAFSGFPFQQIIRPTFKVESIATSSSSSTMTEFTNMELFGLFISSWPDPKDTGFGWGGGPPFAVPGAR